MNLLKSGSGGQGLRNVASFVRTQWTHLPLLHETLCRGRVWGSKGAGGTWKFFFNENTSSMDFTMFFWHGLHQKVVYSFWFRIGWGKNWCVMNNQRSAKETFLNSWLPNQVKQIILVGCESQELSGFHRGLFLFIESSGLIFDVTHIQKRLKQSCNCQNQQLECDTTWHVFWPELWLQIWSAHNSPPSSRLFWHVLESQVQTPQVWAAHTYRHTWMRHY